MQEGFQVVEDFYRKPATWIEGKPQKSFWTGLKTGGKEHHQIQIYRCEACGFLENYAN